MTKSLARLALLWALALAGSCSDEATEVRIDVVPGPNIAAVSKLLNVRVVRDPYGASSVAHPWEAHAWKRRHFTISLTPSDEASDTFAVEVQALGPGTPTPIGWARVITRFVDGQRRHLTLAIDDLCVPSIMCREHETCRAGVCEDAYVDPTRLGSDSADAPSTAMTASGDAGARARDGAVVTLPQPPSDAARDVPTLDAYVPPTPVVPSARDATAPDWGARIADGAVFVRDAGRPDAGRISTSRCFTREVVESEEELEAGDLTRMRNAVGFCFANNTASCVDLLTLATSCSLPRSDNALVPITSYYLFWNSTSGVAMAQGSLGADGGTRQLGTATPISDGVYRIETVFPWTVSLPAGAGSALGLSATCEIELYPAATSLSDSTGEVTLCIP